MRIIDENCRRTSELSGDYHRYSRVRVRVIKNTTCARNECRCLIFTSTRRNRYL